MLTILLILLVDAANLSLN